GETEEPAIPQGHARLQHRLDVRHGARQLPALPLEHPEVAMDEPRVLRVARITQPAQRGRVARRGGRHVPRHGGGIAETEARPAPEHTLPAASGAHPRRPARGCARPSLPPPGPPPAARPRAPVPASACLLYGSRAHARSSPAPRSAASLPRAPPSRRSPPGRP